MVAQQNKGKPFANRVNFRTLDSNIFSYEAVPEDVDCMFTQVFEWGKTENCQKRRSDLHENLTAIGLKYDPDHGSIDQLIRDHGSRMTKEDLEFLSDHQESSHPLNAPLDYCINISERVLHLDRAHYFLGSRDSDWHLPLLVTIREEGLKNQRQRSAEGWEKQLAKQQKFADDVKEKKKKGKQSQKGKGKGKSKSRAGEQETEESHSTRTMFVQSQCTYSSLRRVKQPQFEFLRKGEDGAFPGF